ncbi:MAG: UDP-N-acetylglucosamine 3-dehydrogenase [Alphaproteobacteria bacterium]|nr:MAG: UDP-N-acetylglucosamine 3-dehydrogenase [Alphaproteobacteria bacterium]
MIGVGHFGQYHADKLSRLPASQLVGVVDIDAERAEEIAARHGVPSFVDFREILGLAEAVTIATPPVSHYDIARTCLEAGLHVLVEKPITDNLDHASTLIRIARERGRILQVGHLERFSDAGRMVRELVKRPLYVEASRIGTFRPSANNDVNAVLDLMIHDLDLILDFVRSPIEWVHAVGAPVFSTAEDIASSRIQFGNGCVANVTASRASLRSERRMRVFQDNSYTSIDFLNKKVRIVRRVTGAIMNGMPALEIEETSYGEVDTLAQEIAAFLDSARSGTPPRVTGEDGWRALEAALMITQSLRSHWQMLGEPSFQPRGAVVGRAAGE